MKTIYRKSQKPFGVRSFDFANGASTTTTQTGSKVRVTTVVADDSQLQVTNDVVKCNRCEANYHVQVRLDMKHKLCKCAWCEHIQEYSPSKRMENL